MHIIFLYGLPGVGKYTVGKEVSELTGFKLFHNHMLLNPIIDIFGKNPGPMAHLGEGMLLDFLREAGKEDIPGLIVTFCFGKYISKNFLQKLDRVVKEFGKISYVELTCDKNALQTRIQQPSRGPMYKMSDFETLTQRVASHSIFVPKIKNKHVIQIDNTYLSPRAAATKIVEGDPYLKKMTKKLY